MGSEFTFYDYIDADEGGVNIIKAWLNNGGRIANANFIIRIELLEASLPKGFVDSVWHHPFAEDLKGKWKGFTEIRTKVKKDQYRLIGKKIDRDVYLVSWGFHDGKGWHADITPATAEERVSRMMNNSAYRREHEF